MDVYTINPLSVAEFRQFTAAAIDVDLKIPADSKSRRFTDRKGFLLYKCALICCLSCLIPFITEKSDIRRIFYDTDWCGNFCGIKNEKIDNVNCSGKDYSRKPYSDLKECVELCPWGRILGSYACSQKAMNSISVETTEFYMKKIKEKEETIAQEEKIKPSEESQNEKLPEHIFPTRPPIYTFPTRPPIHIFPTQPPIPERKKEKTCGDLLHSENGDVNVEEYFKCLNIPYQHKEPPKRIIQIEPPIQERKEEKNEDCYKHLSIENANAEEFLKCLKIQSFNNNHRSRRSITEEENVDNSDPFQHCRRSWWKFLIVVVMIIVLSLFIILMTREVPPLPIWCCCACAFIITVFSAYVSWVLYSDSAILEARSRGRIIVPILASLFCVFSFFTPFILYKRLGVLILIFAEAAKVIMTVRRVLILIGIVTVVQIGVLVVFVLGAVQIMTTTELKSVKWNYYEFGELSHFAKFSLVLTLFVANWTMQIFVGFQWMTVAGIVASWYFEEDPTRRRSHVYENFSRTWYHIGTIMYGSLFQPWVPIINHVFKLFTCSYGEGVCLFERVTKAQIWLETYSKNAFIESALHGQSFSRSGRRAYNALLTQAPDIIAMNNSGNTLVLISEFNLIVIATAISYALFLDSANIWVPIAISFIPNAVIITALFRTLQITVNTLSICFCEDRVVNDGYLRPYRASKKLKEFIEKAEELYVKRQTSHRMRSNRLNS